MRTFDIQKEFYALMELMENDSYDVDQVTGEVIDNSLLLQELMSELQVAKNDKLDNIEYIKRELQISIDALKAETKRLSERAKMYERNQDKLTELQDFLLSGEKCKTEKFTFFYAKSESLEIQDESAVPAEYIAFTPKIDKANLKKAVQNGLFIDGIVIKEKIGVRVR